MSRDMALIFFGDPVGKARPRFTRGGHCYTPAATAQYERQLRAEWRAANPGEPLQGAVAVAIHAYYAIPESATVRNRERMMYGELAPLKKPDLDNIVKIVLDALNGVAFADDKQVISISAGKHYSADPRVEVYVTEVDLSDVRQP